MTQQKSVPVELQLIALPVPGKTLPEIFQKQARIYGSGRAALRYKDNGVWNEYSWKDYYENVENVAGGLLELGLKAGDKVCLMSANCPEWVFVYLAVQCLEAYLVPIYPNCTPEQARYVTDHSEARFLFVQNPDQLEKMDHQRSNLAHLERIILMSGSASDGVLKYEELIRLGSRHTEKTSGFLKESIDRLTPGSPAGIIYTSGTTGPPKGVMLTQKNIMFQMNSLMTRYDYMYEEDAISFLPLSHIAEQMLNIAIGIALGNRVSFAQSIDTIRQDLADIRPTLFFSVPRLYEKVYASILETLEGASFLKRSVFRWALGVGEKARAIRNSCRSLPFFLGKRWALAEKLVFGKLKQKVGLDRTCLFASGAAPISAEVSRFFGAMGMDILEVFGQTECTGVCSSTLPGRIIPGAVGPAIPGCEIMIADDGEILTRGDHVFSGYWKDQAGTDEALKDGWLYTGDIGHINEEGYLHVTDRKKDIIVTAGGKNVTPQDVENQLKLNSGVSQAVVIGDKRRYLTCLFTLDKDRLPKLCEHLGIAALTQEEAAVSEAIIGTFQGYVDAVNAGLASYETIKYFRILTNDFSIQTGELTPTLKVKRRVIHEKYRSVIDQMYSQ